MLRLSLLLLLCTPLVLCGRALRMQPGDSVGVTLCQPLLEHSTIEAWIKPATDSAFALPLFAGDPTVWRGYGLIMHDGHAATPGSQMSAFIGGEAFSITGNSVRLSPSRWTHVALVRDESRWYLYRNGMLVGRGVRIYEQPVTHLRIGVGYSGLIDDVRVWTRSLSNDEIRASHAAQVSPTANGLIAYYAMESIADTLSNTASAGAGCSARIHGSGARLTYDNAPLAGRAAPRIELTEIAEHMQFFARDESDSATVELRGHVYDRECDSIVFDILRNDTLIASHSAAMRFYDGSAPFEHNVRIAAELALYTVQVRARVAGEWMPLFESADLVAGDVYMIAGQSNSHPTDPLATWTSPYVRSFGIQTPDANYATYDRADIFWGAANGHGHGNSYSGPYLVGVWGMRLAQLMIDSFGIPLFFINGGAGGSSIEQNARNDDDARDLTTIYGRTLYRFHRSGLTGHVRAIFWHQGESNGLWKYYDNFRTLHARWRADYPSVERVYLFQIRPGCGGSRHVELRELQRTIADSLADITPLATVGLGGHDGCHYTYAGYTELANQAFRFVRRDIAGDSASLTHPNIRRAWFTSSRRDEVALVFDASAPIVWPSDTVVAGFSRSIVDAFYLDGDSSLVASGRASGDTVFLRLRSPSTASTIGYVPDKNYPGTSVLYEGPWLVDATGLGAFAFDAIPIEQAPLAIPPVSTSTELTIAPNPAVGRTTLRFGLAAVARVRLTLADAAGRETLLLDERIASGPREITLDDLASGVYQCVLVVNGSRTVRSFVVY